MRGMVTSTRKLLSVIEAFIARTGMGESYFGKRATGNSELIARLRAGGRVWPETAAKVVSFIRDYDARPCGHVREGKAIQPLDAGSPSGGAAGNRTPEADSANAAR